MVWCGMSPRSGWVALSDLITQQFDGHPFASWRGIGEVKQRGWIERQTVPGPKGGIPPGAKQGKRCTDLHNLGWHSFQQLCLTIARDILGQSVESFLDSNDGGRDGAFAGSWNPTGKENISGHFVIQCKFTSRANHQLRPSDLSDELAKTTRLVREGRCDCYVLLTNAGMSGRQAEKIAGSVQRRRCKTRAPLRSTWICQQIHDSKRLRMLVPRVYGLGDLSQILDHRAYSQARALLASLRDDLSKIVVTGAYRRSAAALDKHGFVLLIGEPAAGKTTIASLLAMGALDQWGASTLKLDSPDKVKEHWNPDESSQFFWLDDAFGVMQYESSLVHRWNHILPDIRTMLRKGAKVVMTSVLPSSSVGEESLSPNHPDTSSRF